MIAVTGSTGHLGRLIIQNLLDRGIPPDSIVGIARTPAKAADLAERGVQIRQADYDDPKSLAAALAGVTRLLLVSGSEVGQRVAQHRNVIDAAVGEGIELLAYTSILRAESSRVRLAEEHRATEEMILGSGLRFVLLRNGWYLENYTENLGPALEHGVLLGAAGEGRISAATRADYAAAAAAVIAAEPGDNAIHELGGDDAFTMPELAAEVARQSGRPVEYRNLPEEEYARALVEVGLPEPYARVLADSDRGVARGELYTDSGDLRRLIGRPTTTPAEAIAAALKDGG